MSHFKFYSAVVPLVLSGCIKKAEEKPTEKTGFVAQRFEMQSAPN